MSCVEQSRRYSGAPVHSLTQERLHRDNGNQRETRNFRGVLTPTDVNEWLGG